MSSNAWPTVLMPSSSSSSTVMSNSSSRSMTIWTRSRLSASRSSAKLDSSLISSTGLLRLSAAVLRKRSSSSSLIVVGLLVGGGSGSVSHGEAAVHGADGAPCNVERAREVRVDDVVPVGILHARQQRVARDAGVGDQDPNLAEVRFDLAEHFVDGRGVRDVAGEARKLVGRRRP